MQPGTGSAVSANSDLLGVLRERQAQAGAFGACHAAAVASPDAMLYWLARAAKEAREAAGRKQVHIAAEADRDQSTIYRFEQAAGWPRITDRIVAAYAADLDVEPIDVWEQALRMWRSHVDGSDVKRLADEAGRAGEAEAQRTTAQRPAGDTGPADRRPGSSGH